MLTCPHALAPNKYQRWKIFHLQRFTRQEEATISNKYNSPNTGALKETKDREGHRWEHISAQTRAERSKRLQLELNGTTTNCLISPSIGTRSKLWKRQTSSQWARSNHKKIMQHMSLKHHSTLCKNGCIPRIRRTELPSYSRYLR